MSAWHLLFAVFQKYIYCVCLKRLTAILLVLLFLFNLAGYRLFFLYIQLRADASYITAIDNNRYDESQMITLKVDLDMPYLPENSGFERVNGEINVDGKIYKFVKRRIYNGQLVLLCLPDERKAKIRAATDNYFADSNDLPGANDQTTTPKTNIAKHLVTDFDHHYLPFAFLQIDIPGIPHQSPDQAPLCSRSVHTPGQPPDRLS